MSAKAVLMGVWRLLVLGTLAGAVWAVPCDTMSRVKAALVLGPVA